jgi:hypothetical protein
MIPQPAVGSITSRGVAGYDEESAAAAPGLLGTTSHAMVRRSPPTRPRLRRPLRDVLESVKRYGRRAAETLVLGYDAPNGTGQLIAKGAALIKRAQAACGAP